MNGNALLELTEAAGRYAVSCLHFRRRKTRKYTHYSPMTDDDRADTAYWCARIAARWGNMWLDRQ